MKISNKLLLATLALAAAAPAYAAMEKQPAFPGAEGFGRYTTGGRGGNVYHVTNLLDNGTGSLRWALSQAGPRTIVFDVSGTIHLSSGLSIPANTTIAGQSAPGDGICVADYPVTVGNNCIVRYMRFRLGNKNVLKNGADGWDGLSAMDSHDIIIDHCSISWSIDECCSVLGNVNTTVQWSMVDQSLVNAGHSKGAHGYGGNWGGSGASFHHNLVAHHGSRTPRLGPRPTTQLDERMDMRNNVIYNYGGNGCYGGEGMDVNIVNNYYKPGPATPSNARKYRIAGIGIRTNKYVEQYPDYAPALHKWGHYFVTGNVNPDHALMTRDNWNYGILQQIDTSASATDGTWNDQVKAEIKLAEPIRFIATTTHSAEDAYARVLDYVGASLHRDSHDEQIVSDTRNGAATATGSGNSKGLINSQDDNKPADAPSNWSAWPTLTSTEAPADTDRDGIPDRWELENGLDPNNAADAKEYNADGYTMLEVYLNSIVEHITEAQNAGGVIEGDIEVYPDVEESYDLSVEKRIGSSWDFEGGFSMSCVGGSFSTYGNYIGIPRDLNCTLLFPMNMQLEGIRFTGHGRYSTSSYTDAELVEINGKSYETGTYNLPKGRDAEGDVTIMFDEPVRNGALSMKWVGNNPEVLITLFTAERTAVAGIDDIIISEAPAQADTRWFNLQGIEVREPLAPGLYIRGGKKVLVK
ncbi:MAG: pectate lyase [Muribaculaceae bacterium]|nr:pectate lyase [Muribaculaceae bacterium]